MPARCKEKLQPCTKTLKLETRGDVVGCCHLKEHCTDERAGLAEKRREQRCAKRSIPESSKFGASIHTRCVFAVEVSMIGGPFYCGIFSV